MLTTGSVFANDFRVLRPLAEGGMGAVFVVEQLSTGKERALKVMRPGMVHDATLRSRFAREARIGAQIESDHVVEVVSAGVDEATNTPWLAMELLRGQHLGDALARKGRFSPATVKEIFRQLGHALASAHEKGIVHRDLKPENIFLSHSRRHDESSVVKVLDFGIARIMQESRATGATLGGLGTPLWMAPEQTHGGAITPATDVWALGLIAFYLLTGRSYWRSAQNDAALPVILTELCVHPLAPASVRASELGCPVALSQEFDAWFARCIVREPERRFAQAGSAVESFQALPESLAWDIGAGAAAGVARTMVMHSPPPTAPPPRRRPTAGGVALVIAALLVPVGAGAWWLQRTVAAPRDLHHVSAMVQPVVVGQAGSPAVPVVPVVTPPVARPAVVAPALAAPPPACRPPQHQSDGHCCDAGEEWLPARSRCFCVLAGGCRARPGPSAPVTSQPNPRRRRDRATSVERPRTSMTAPTLGSAPTQPAWPPTPALERTRPVAPTWGSAPSQTVQGSEPTPNPVRGTAPQGSGAESGTVEGRVPAVAPLR